MVDVTRRGQQGAASVISLFHEPRYPDIIGDVPETRDIMIRKLPEDCYRLLRTVAAETDATYAEIVAVALRAASESLADRVRESKP